MRIVADNAVRTAALATIRGLIASGLAGNDIYSPETFVVDAPTAGLRDHAEVALDLLGAVFLLDNRAAVRCELPQWVRAELGLDAPDAPEIVTPLASRALPVERAELEHTLRDVYPDQTVDLIMSTVFADAPGHVGEQARQAAERAQR